MHRIVATPAIVLGKRGVGEANTLVTLLTQDLGLVRASAKSARLARSKLRYGLEPLMQGRYSLVRGKWEWKIVGVERVSKNLVAGDLLGRAAAGRVTRLLLRLVSGEEPVPELYKTVTEGLTCLARVEEVREHVEVVLVLRILAHLGYLPKTRELAPFMEEDFFSLELAAAAARSRNLLIRAINESLGATGL